MKRITYRGTKNTSLIFTPEEQTILFSSSNGNLYKAKVEKKSQFYKYMEDMDNGISLGAYFNRELNQNLDFQKIHDHQKELQHYHDTTVGLWCIDKNPCDVDKGWILKNAFRLKEIK